MKKLLLLLFIVSFFITGIVKSQPADAAYAKYQSGDYLSAIKLYKEEIARLPAPHRIRLLGICYLMLDSISQAKHQFETVVDGGNNNKFNDYIKLDCCLRLGDIYQMEKKYREALIYYKKHESLLHTVRIDDFNRTRYYFINAYDQGKCYSALMLTDSAIITITPHIFTPHQALDISGVIFKANINWKDSLLHDTVCRYYVSLLKTQYPIKRIKAELKKAEHDFVFNENRHTDKSSNFLWEEVQCSTAMFGIPVLLASFGVGNRPDLLLEELKKPQYTKVYQLDRFRQLLVCRLIRNLTD